MKGLLATGARLWSRWRALVSRFYRLPLVYPTLSTIGHTVGGFFRADGLIMAAAIAFYAVLSLIPFLLLLFSIAGFILKGVGEQYGDPQSLFSHLETYIQAVVPFMGADVLDQLRNMAVHRQFLGVTGLLMLFITAGLVFRTMEVSFARIFGTRPRPVFVTHALFAVFALVVVLLFLGLHLLGSFSGSLISAHDTSTGRELANFLRTHSLLRHGVTLLSAAIVFFVLQKAFNREKVRLRHLLAGAGLFAILWIIAAKAFGYYTRHIAQFSFLYGSLAALAVVVVWIFYAACVLLLCSQFIEVLHHRRAVAQGGGSEGGSSPPGPGPDRPTTGINGAA